MTMTDERTTAEHLEVRTATTNAEREAVYRFRYEIYVEEMGRYRAVADHRNRHLADQEDDHSWIIYASAGDEVVGSFRVTWGGDGFSKRQIEQYQLAPFLAQVPAERMAVGERTMIAAQWRGADLFATLGTGSVELCDAHDVRIVFGACEPHLISFYARYQRPYGTQNINSPEAGFLIPLVSFPQGTDALVDFGNDGELPGCVADVLNGTGTVLSAPLVGEDRYRRWVKDAVAALQSSVFDGLDDEQLSRCLERSNVITCRAGDRLLKAGGPARNVFVVLCGALDVSRDGTTVGTVGPGEVVGEMAYLLSQPRGFDVDVVDEETQVLSLSERVLAQLTDSSPAAAARVMSNISRQVCRRLSATVTPDHPTPSDEQHEPTVKIDSTRCINWDNQL